MYPSSALFRSDTVIGGVLTLGKRICRQICRDHLAGTILRVRVPQQLIDAGGRLSLEVQHVALPS